MGYLNNDNENHDNNDNESKSVKKGVDMPSCVGAKVCLDGGK